MSNPIEDSGHPLAFRCGDGTRPALLGAGQGQAIYTVETRMLSGHQKEAVVREGAGGQAWRMVSDEGHHLKGHDVAPFPLGFFNAGIQGDILARIAAFGRAEGLDLSQTQTALRNYYWFEGSFADGSGKGHADPAELGIDLKGASAAGVVARALRASPAIAALGADSTATFALYVNGRRERVTTIPASDAADAADPYLVHASAPAPLGSGGADPIRKSGQVQEGTVEAFPDTVDGRLLRRVAGRAAPARDGGVETETWLDLPGMSHFALRSDDRSEGNTAPSGLAYFAAGIAFCFMTQLSRYMAAMKLDTGHLRLVQTCPFEVNGNGQAVAHPVDTHLFLNGRADAQTHEMLVRVAANTCYLHAALKSTLQMSIDTGDGPQDMANVLSTGQMA